METSGLTSTAINALLFLRVNSSVQLVHFHFEKKPGHIGLETDLVGGDGGLVRVTAELELVFRERLLFVVNCPISVRLWNEQWIQSLLSLPEPNYCETSVHISLDDTNSPLQMLIEAPAVLDSLVDIFLSIIGHRLAIQTFRII